MSDFSQLQKISEVFEYSEGVMESSIAYCFKVLKRHLHGNDVLELGPAEGVMTGLLVQTGKDITIVEGSTKYCNSIAKKHPTVTVVNSLFEEYQPAKQFDTIVLGHVIEHVVDPADLLARVKTWLKPGGRIFAAVPNASSIHRKAAVLMGMLPTEDSLNERDIQHGHRRVYNPDNFRQVFIDAGMNIDLFGGYWLKPLANSQIEQSWTQPMIDAFMLLGEELPEIAGEIYVVASVK